MKIPPMLQLDNQDLKKAEKSPEKTQLTTTSTLVTNVRFFKNCLSISSK